MFFRKSGRNLTPCRLLRIPISVFPGGRAHLLCKLAGEMLCIFIAAQACNLTDFMIAVLQKLFRLADAGADQIHLEGHSEKLLIQFLEIKPA